MTTTTRLPIKVSGYIEIVDHKVTRVVVDPTDYDYSPWPLTSAFGEDPIVMQIDNGPDQRELEGDADLVMPIRGMAERQLDSALWVVTTPAFRGDGDAGG